MAKVLQNFLIGVGLDTEQYDKGAQGVESSLARMRSLVGFTGTAIAGAFALASTAAINAGNRVDRLNLSFEKFRTSPQFIHSYQNAIEALGGSADEATAAINTAESRLASFRQTGELPGLIDLELAGVDTFALTRAETGQDFLRELARQIPDLTQEQQLRAQETLGLSDAVMRSLRGGVGELDAAVKRAGELYGEFGRATEAAREYNRVLSELNTQFAGIGETLAEKMLPSFTGILKSTSDFISQNKSGIDGLLDQAAQNPAAAGLLTGGAAAAAAGAAARGVGLRTVGQSLMRAGPYGMAAGTGLLAYEASKDLAWSDWWDMSVNSARDSWRSMTWQNDYSGLPDAPYGSEVPIVAPGTIIPLERARAPLSLDRSNDGAPVYAGGEIGNLEAASTSPDVIMVRDQRQQAEQRAMPQRVNVQSNLQVRMELDGQALDSRVIEVVQRRDHDAADDINVSVDR
ncbi:hypothetical protein [Bordetella bronchiseptica]|uniref:hypothetical protein n=1 Tax=Bordetella bronchiseptica TaxID=518 RepID=UPI0012473B63|nr:hypothetical protein [Bordetella bronchiseptica]KAB1444208.1 hypothetical protein F7D00_21360 [Bordetella bronchiseptica]KAB1569314.1 hypothetical protein F7890_21360 [Bordetella bronchiseptica]